MERLKELLPQYVENKSEADAYKKICEKENAEIKSIMVENGETEYTVGEYTAKYIVTVKEVFDEAKLVCVLKNADADNSLGIIKTVEVVDMDALESALYNTKFSSDIIAKISDCKITKEVPQLRVSKKKKKEEAE